MAITYSTTLYHAQASKIIQTAKPVIKFTSFQTESLITAIMSGFRAATTEEKEKIIESFMKDLGTFTTHITGCNDALAVCCAVCDSMPKKANDWSWVDVDQFKDYANKCCLQKKHVAPHYKNDNLVQYYTASDPDLSQYVLSPSSLIDSHKKTIVVCNQCLDHFKKHTKRMSQPPLESIANGYLIGSAPSVLKELSDAELAIVSQVRISCHSFVFFAGAHHAVQGWHTLFKNKAARHVGNIAQAADAGMTGDLIVVLCGPFTTTQRALALKKTQVRADKVIAAFEWLQENNFHYKDVVIPAAEDLPAPILIEENV